MELWQRRERLQAIVVDGRVIEIQVQKIGKFSDRFHSGVAHSGVPQVEPDKFLHSREMCEAVVGDAGHFAQIELSQLLHILQVCQAVTRDVSGAQEKNSHLREILQVLQALVANVDAHEIEII